MSFSQLTIEKRFFIQKAKDKGLSNKEIAHSLGCHPTTVGRELKRNSKGGHYDYQEAQSSRDNRQLYKKKPRKLTNKIVSRIKKLLLKQLSPEQICGYLNKTKVIKLHHECIYQFIVKDKQQGGSLFKNLRYFRGRRNKSRYKNSASTRIPNRTCISERPAAVKQGDCEADLIIGKDHKSALFTLVCRKSLYTRIIKLSSKKAQFLADIICVDLIDIKDKLRSITFDNGLEFARHEQIANQLEVFTYFAHPYSSYERGCNENINGLIRQYFPKKTDFKQVSNDDVLRVQELLNNRPRKKLNYKTPNEVFLKKSVDLFVA